MRSKVEAPSTRRRLSSIAVLLAALGFGSPALGAADLVITNLSTAPVGVVGLQVPVNVQVRNVGSLFSSSGPFDVAVRLGTPGCGSLLLPILAQYSVGNLAQNQSDTRILSVTIPAGVLPGPYAICVQADYNDDVPESNENNNLRGQNLSIVECVIDAHCEDNNLCNGPNLCQANECVLTIEFCTDFVDCTVDGCDPATGQCTYLPQDSLCDDGVQCTIDSCDTALDCQHQTDDSVCDDGVQCTIDSCDAALDCQYQTDDSSCDDGAFCNGIETCDEVLDCQEIPNAAIDDGIACTDDICNEGTDSIDHSPIHASCDDNLYCTGAGVCDVVVGCTYPTPVDCDFLVCFDGVCNQTTGLCDQTPTSVPPGPALCEEIGPNMTGTWEGWWPASGALCTRWLTTAILHPAGQADFSGSFIAEAIPGFTCDPFSIGGSVSGYSGGGNIVFVASSPEIGEIHFYGDYPEGDELTAQSDDLLQLGLNATRTAPDADADGVSDPVEDEAPNAGDGNGDGTLDSQQASVASLPDAEGQGYLTLEAVGCGTLTDVAALTRYELGLEPSVIDWYLGQMGWQLPLGLVEFRAPCAAVALTIYYHGTGSLLPPYVKYGPPVPGAGGEDFYALYAPAAVFGSTVIDGNAVATVTLNLEDGELGDDTGVDGQIVDAGGPAGIGVEVPAMGLMGHGVVVLSLIGAVWLRGRRRAGGVQ